MNSRRIAQYTGPLSALMMVSGAPAAPPADPPVLLPGPETFGELSRAAVLYFERGGEAALKPGRLVEGLEPQWYNPRTGTWTPAEPAAGGVFRAPDEEDWVLRLSPPSRP
jgi:hypothetical protein